MSRVTAKTAEQKTPVFKGPKAQGKARYWAQQLRAVGGRVRP